MKSEKVNGFTLIELLAVIVILAIILVIAIPKILNVIEETKKDSLKNTAQLIADSAEKEKISNELLEKDDDITCKRVAKITDEDYASCKITFDEEGNAKVSIIGKGKFDGLAVIDGTKMSSDVIELELPEYGVGKTYIENLYNNEVLRKANDLKKDNTPDENIRYYGSNPNNYVRFNNELWRIIGVFGENIKLVRSEKLGNLSWDSSESTINSGYGINQWGESTDTNGNSYAGSDLQVYLNDMYYGGVEVMCYKTSNNTTITCPTKMLDEISKSLIDNHTWNTGAINLNDSTIVNLQSYEMNTVPFYNAERGTVNGKICSSGNYCNNDVVTRTTTWTGYVGLPYTTDYSYASSESVCETNMNAGNINIQKQIYNMTCKKNNWMHHGSTMQEGSWTLSTVAHPNRAFGIWFIYGGGLVGDERASLPLMVFPSVYLKNKVKIESGNGTSSNPYILKLGN